jgi:hypothetical protein
VRARNLKLTAVPALAVAFAALLAMIASGGDASADGRDGGIPADAGARDAAAPFAITRTPPDPPAMSERQQWVFDLRWDRGDVYLLEVHKVDMGEPHMTPRVMGRFALELFEGPTVIERVRFDFPMLGAPEATDGGWKAPARFEPKLRTRIGVLFPATKRGTKLELWDRATNVRMPLPWPPREGTMSADAGVR